MDKKNGKATIAVAVITAFVTTFTGSALNMSIPAIGAEFDVGAGYVGWLVTGYTLTVAALSVPFGRIADVTCRRAILIYGIAAFSVCCGIAVFSSSMTMLLAVRIAQGAGAAMIFSTNTAVLISVFPDDARGRVLGYSIAATYAGLSAGPVIGGLLNYNFGWRSTFVITGILSALSLLAAIKGLPREKYESLRRPPDIAGNILYMLFIVLLMYGLSEIGTGPVPAAAAALGSVLAVVFVLHEAKVRDPAVDVNIFKEIPGYTCMNIAAMINYGATFAVSYLMSIYLQVISGYTSQMAGVIMIVQPLMIAGLSPLAGRMSDRLSPHIMSSVGMALCGAGAVILAFAGADTALAIIVTALAVTGLGSALFSSPNTNAVMASVDREDYGVASSVLATMRSIGNTLSMAVVTAAATALMSDATLMEASHEDMIIMMRISFSIFSLFCAAGIFFSIKGKKACS